MSYWDNISSLQLKQTAKGVATYGQTLEENTELDADQRLTYLEEELIDGLMYIEHIKANEKPAEGMIRVKADIPPELIEDWRLFVVLHGGKVIK